MDKPQDLEQSPSTQTCVKCRQDKPIDAFVSRTKSKRPTTWCIDCCIEGREGNRRWVERKRQASGGIPTRPLEKAEDNVGNGQPSSGPEQPQIPTQSQVPYEVYPSPVYCPGNYGYKCPPGGFQQIVTPPLNPQPMYPLMWGYYPPYPSYPSMPMMRTAQWVATNSSDLQSSIQKGEQMMGMSIKRLPDGGKVASKESRETAPTASSSDGADSDDESSNDEDDGGQPESGLPDGLQKEIDGHGAAKGPDCSAEDGFFKAPYFICMACDTPRPNRLGEDGICVYCFEHPTQYCVKGGHEDDKIFFMDSDGVQHLDCNRCCDD